MKTITFKVAMDSEQAKAGNHKTVTLNVDMEKVSRETLETLACSAQVVRWQGEIRSHWGETIPATVEFGVPLFGTGRKTTVREMSVDEAIAKVSTMGRLAQLKTLVKMYDTIGQEVPENIMTELDELLMEEVEGNLK